MKEKYIKRLLLIWCLILIYGTLLPFNFKILTNFSIFNILSYISIPTRISKSDFVLNILIFIPFGFLFSALNEKRVGNYIRLILALLFITTIFSFLLESSQIFLPTRISSFSDIIAQIIGSILGAVLFIKFKNHLFNFLSTEININDKLRISIYAYSLILLIYGLLPGDISISPVFVYHKWKRGLIKLIPFYHETIAVILHNFSSQFVLYVPLGLLVALYYKYSKDILLLKVIFISGSVSLFIELMQLFTNYHVTDLGEVLASILGACFGAYVYISKSEIIKRYISILVISLFIIVYSLYPYKFSTNIVEKFISISFVPFSIYYSMPFFFAIESIFHKFLFFNILGFYIALCNQNFSFKKLYLLAIFCSLIISIILMLGQLFISIRIFDISDIMIAILGAISGVLIYRNFFVFIIQNMESYHGMESSSI